MSDNCKYCERIVEDLHAEGLKCEACHKFVHITCLKRGSVPGGLTGDVFFNFTCQECSSGQTEIFIRDRMPWFQAIVLILYHINMKTPGLARKGYFHWKMHLATLIDRHWDIIFGKSFKRKKKWIGTISGTLSHLSPCFFYSGTANFGEQGWWTLTFPKLTPNVTMKLYAEFMVMKVKVKDTMITDFEMLVDILKSKGYGETFLKSVNDQAEVNPIPATLEVEIKEELEEKGALQPTVKFEASPKKFYKASNGKRKAQDDLILPATPEVKNEEEQEAEDTKCQQEPLKFMDPMCHYNTALSTISHIQGIQIKAKLLGGLREETILSPYSSLYLKPYIRRDVDNTPKWLQLMAEIQVRANLKNDDFKLPPRSTIDYVYVQPSHIPAINSLCNQFFWPGIDLTECLQYPDFSCVVLYKKLIVGFAFVVPDVNFHENYVSFIFVRPGWRNMGIAKFMMYHLIQTSIGKDLTLHVSINNSALFLYQKFGFKVEHVVQNFYDKYFRQDAKESKHAYFCRLER